MRLLFFVLFALLIYMVWRSGRERPPRVDTEKPEEMGAPQKMLRCVVCATHVPATDVVHGKLGSYCSIQHRDQQEN